MEVAPATPEQWARAYVSPGLQLEKALREQAHTHILMRSWKRGQERVSLRCMLCTHVEYEEVPRDDQR